MRLTVDIDPSSGFCAGVIKAISTAEQYLSTHDKLYSLGAVVHNDEELARLSAMGLERIDTLANLGDPTPVLIRAHGEPPQTYREAAAAGIPLIDCTCPVVIRLQKSIREAWERLEPKQGTLLIFGKKGHAEVLGLLGQTDGKALIVENLEQLDALDIPVEGEVEIFSQTTKSPVEYAALCQKLRERVGESRLTVHDTICKQVSSRHKSLADFAISHDIIIFVSGKSSSNGKVLFDLCRSYNPRCYALSSGSGLEPGWFREGDRVGVCGATSTPKWLLENIKNEILTNNY